MKYRVKKGAHYFWPRMIGILIGNTIERLVEFNRTNSYQFASEDQLDVNKLFGIGYPWSHHKNSARWGWNYNPENNRIRLYAYCYNRGIRSIDYVCDVPKNVFIALKIDVFENKYVFTAMDGTNRWRVLGEASVLHSHEKKIKYILGCYFGGNNPSPHDMNIIIKKK
jgi:hypothetical protein